MQIEVTAKGKTLQGISDLTLMAPIKPGLIDALDTRTYSSRLRLLLRTLNTGRSQAREYSSVRPFADSVERIHSIHSFRLAILDDAQPRLLLAATFDSAWEPYIRVIWRDLGPLLDVIFCNCEGYVTAFDHSYTEYAAWVRSAQLGTEFFYNATPLTVDDLQYLRQSERLHRDGPTASAADLAATGMVVADPQQVALQTVKDYPTEVVSQGMSALTALYRLADMYPPGTRDGDILLRASHQLLLEISPRPGRPSPFPPDSPVRKLFGPQIEWFERGVPDRNSPAAPTVPAPDLADVQGGIMSGYDATHGCLLLVGFDSTQALQGCLDKVIPQVSTERSDKAPGRVQMNLSFTYEGLRLAGLSDAELAGFPQEFREGMESRASVLGDVRCNHPRNWALPERNWPPADDGRKGVIERIQMSMVHMLVQLQVQSDGAAGDHALVDKHPLHDKVAELSSLLGKQLLSVQATRRNLDGSFDGKQKNMPREHFGFVDGLSQPVLDPAQAGTNWRNLMPLGELLIGHANASGDVPPHNPLWHNGSYLVVRKLRQDVAALNGVVDAAAKGTSLSRDTIKAKMMGRTPDGDALADPGKKLSNDFTYTQDATGQGCPFQAHIRRANPRTVDKPIVPRIMRRGMSYGPRYDESQPDAASNQQERGLMFMSYSASIAEHFEVIQRWITGGNSSGTFSGQSDPFLGVPQPGDPRTFAFSHEGATLRMDLNDKAAKPFVQLQWGTYLFVPSIKALAALRDKAAAATTAPAAPSLWSVKVGEAYIQKLLQAEKLGAPGMSQQWKALLEDISARSSNTSASVWAAIRENHGGVLRTPYGVLVAGKDLVMQVFQNASGHYSVSGYAHRMRQSFGEIYLGLDDGEAYDTQATAVNKALMDVSKPEAFAIAHAATQSFLTQAIGAAKAQAQHMGSPVWDLSLDMKDMSDAVLAGLCDHWFGLPDDNHRIDAGGWQWNWKPEDPPRCPGHFLSPSRYMFQPQPGPSATSFGQDHGQTLLAAFKLLVNDHRSNSSMPTAPLAQKLFAAFADTPESNDLLASTFIGVLMGFLPTVDGNLRATLYEWMNDRSLWDLQNTLMQNPKDAYQRALDVLQLPLMRTMQLRPVPEVVWRTATSPHRLGSGDTAVDIVPGDIVVVGIVSSTQAELAAPRASGCPMHVTNATNVFPVFGGDRRATPHPTHACPAYEMAMGVLLGMISALLECGTMRPTPSPLILNWRGRVQPEGSGQTAA